VHCSSIICTEGPQDSEQGSHPNFRLAFHIHCMRQSSPKVKPGRKMTFLKTFCSASTLEQIFTLAHTLHRRDQRMPAKTAPVRRVSSPRGAPGARNRSHLCTLSHLLPSIVQLPLRCSAACAPMHLQKDEALIVKGHTCIDACLYQDTSSLNSFARSGALVPLCNAAAVLHGL